MKSSPQNPNPELIRHTRHRTRDCRMQGARANVPTDERLHGITVLLAHTDQDAERLEPVNERREHRTTCIPPVKPSQDQATAVVDDEHGNARRVRKFEESFSSSSSFCAPQRSPPCTLGFAPPARPSVAAQARRARHGAPAEPHPTPPPPFAPATRAGGGRRPAGRRACHRRQGAQEA